MTPDDFWREADIADAQIPLGISIGLADAIWVWRMFGLTDEIALVLTSGDNLSKADREWLAGYIQGTIRLPPCKPPLAHLLQSPKAVAVREAHNEIERLISEWTAAGQKRRGLKARAIDAAAAKFCPAGITGDDFREKLETFVRRSKRQKRPLSPPLQIRYVADRQLPADDNDSGSGRVLLAIRRPPKPEDAFLLSNGEVEFLFNNGDVIIISRGDERLFGPMIYRAAYLRYRKQKSAL